MFIKGRALKSGMGQGDNEEGEQKLPPQNGSSGPNSSKRNMVLSHLRERVHDAMSSSTSRFIHKHLQRRHTPKKKQEMGPLLSWREGIVRLTSCTLCREHHGAGKH